MSDSKINMKWRSAFAYAWDLAERGTADAAAELREIGLNAVTPRYGPTWVMAMEGQPDTAAYAPSPILQ